MPSLRVFTPVLSTLVCQVSYAQHVMSMTKQLNDGTVMPVVGLGTWKSPPGEVEAAVRHAICQAGYRHIDAAQIYLNQEEVGRGIRHALEKCGVTRGALWVTSKIWLTDFEDVYPAAERILRELGLAYVDQLLLHWPTPYKAPPEGCPPDCPEAFSGTDDAMRPRGPDGNLVTSDYSLASSWLQLQKVRDAGLVRSIGVSNFSPDEIDSLLKEEGATVPAVNQVESHVFWNQAALRKSMAKRNIALVAYSPLGNPALYSSRLEGMGSSLIAEVAEESGLTPAQVMLSFLIHLGDVVLPKSVTPSRIESNINFSMGLSASQLARLAKAAPQSRMANPKNRPGGKLVFPDDADEELELPPAAEAKTEL